MVVSRNAQILPHNRGSALEVSMPKKPGPLPKPAKLKGEGPSASEQVSQDRDAGLTQAEAAIKDYQEGRTLTSEDLWKKVDAGLKPDSRMVEIVCRAVDVLGDPEKARRWLDSPLRALGGRTPREVAATDLPSVLAVLTRIEYGVHG